jgi:hypothetical protein
MPDIVPGTGAPVNGGGLANFNPDAAAQNLAAVGQPPPMMGPPVPVEARPIEGPPVPAGLPVPVAPPPGTLPVSPTGNPTPTPALPVTDPQAVSRQAIGDAQAAQTDEAKAALAEGKAQQEKADADAATAQKASDEIRKRQEDADRTQQASDVTRARLVAIADKADSDVANFKHTDYKDTIPLSSKIALIAGAALSGLGGASDPMAQINKNIARHFETEKADLTSKENFAKAKRGGVDDFDRHVNDQRMYLEFSERNYREALAKEIEAQGLRSGKPVAAAKAQQMAAKVRMDGDAKLTTMVDQYTKGEEARAHAALFASKARAAGKGGGGGAGSDAMSQFVDAAGALKPGEPIPASLVKLGGKAGFKLKEISTQIEKYRGSGVKSETAAAKAEAAGGMDPKNAYREDGQVVGYVPSGRGGAAAFGARVVKYNTAVRALSELEQRARNATGGSLPWGPEFHSAVLAIASTTQAGSTDKNVAHEEGTLKGPLGVVSADAIHHKIEELKTQLGEFKSQLIPASKAAAPAAGGGGIAKSVKMPDGRVLNFDAAGNPVK